MRLVFILQKISRSILYSFIGLTDRRNHIALRAHETNAGITDISCNYHFASDDVFEWEVQTSPQNVNDAISGDLYTSQDSFVNDMAAYFGGKLAASYAEVTTVKFIERVDYSNELSGLKFRAQCSKPILKTEVRTKIVSTIQQVYYEMIPFYFFSIIETAGVPNTCDIPKPETITVVTKNINWNRPVQVPVAVGPGYPTTPGYPSTEAYSTTKKYHSTHGPRSTQAYPQCSFSIYTQQYDLQQLEQSGTTVETVCSDTMQQLEAALQEFYSETPVQTSYTVSQTETLVTVCYNVLYNCDQPVTTVTSSGETTTIEVNLNPEKAKIDQSIQCGLYLFFENITKHSVFLYRSH